MVHLRIVVLVLLSPLASTAPIPSSPHDEEIGIHSGLLNEAKSGNSTAQAHLGLDYYFGQNEVTKDEETGLMWIAKAAEGGDANSQEFMAKLFDMGHKSLTKSKKESARFAEMAANQGKVNSMQILGKLHYLGEGLERMTEKDRYKKAFQWYSKAARLGSMSSMVDLGDLYRLGKGTKVDFKKAVSWYERVIAMEPELMKSANDKPSWAANKTTVARAFNTLGGMTFAGQGVDADSYGALKYLDKAGAYGNVNAKGNAQKIRDMEAKKEAKRKLKEEGPAMHTEL